MQEVSRCGVFGTCTFRVGITYSASEQSLKQWVLEPNPEPCNLKLQKRSYILRVSRCHMEIWSGSQLEIKTLSNTALKTLGNVDRLITMKPHGCLRRCQSFSPERTIEV